MKTFLLIFSILLFAFTTNADPVLDIDGDPLLPGHQYYVYPHIWGPTGGGLSPGKTGNQNTCPVSVLSLPFWNDRGKPLIFTPLLDTGIVPTDSALDIAFAEAPDCAESGKWLIVDDMKGEYWSVGIGGPQDHQGYQTLTGYFKIHKLGSFAYRFSFLPLVNAPTSGYIGQARDKDGNIRLVVTVYYHADKCNAVTLFSNVFASGRLPELSTQKANWSEMPVVIPVSDEVSGGLGLAIAGNQ
ncbi:hypothetical protein L6164_033218 [Bauhinia variegata]|uniref:Uncharacterized protein n=1 Tax=Bauhinia variegata TaxID=167791 RepID=A0ACB9KR78_BAUVA|nr:hypothetical protein L6164_033218 [Bauhinia variegata]